MNFGYLTPDAWAAFERDYPRAYHFLLQASLRQEYAHLGRLGAARTAWQAARYAELDTLFTELDARTAAQLTLVEAPVREPLPPWAAASVMGS